MNRKHAITARVHGAHSLIMVEGSRTAFAVQNDPWLRVLWRVAQALQNWGTPSTTPLFSPRSTVRHTSQNRIVKNQYNDRERVEDNFPTPCVLIICYLESIATLSNSLSSCHSAIALKLGRLKPTTPLHTLHSHQQSPRRRATPIYLNTLRHSSPYKMPAVMSTLDRSNFKVVSSRFVFCFNSLLIYPP